MTPQRSHPAGLPSLYVSQALCNFSFYGIKSIFVLFAISQLALDETEAFLLFSTFMSLCYATCLIGGTLADKGLGLRNSLIIGGGLSASGLLCFLVPHKDWCLLGLALISLGSGFFKPNLSTAVGLFFGDPKDPRKDKAYLYSYMAMNAGGLLGPLLVGFVSNRLGWNYGMGLVAMTFLTTTCLFYRNVKFNTSEDPQARTTSPQAQGFALVIILIIPSLYFLLKYPGSFHGLMGIIALGSLVYLARIAHTCTPAERKDVLRIIFCIILFALSCSIFEQAGSSLVLFFDKAVDRQVLNHEIPAAAFLSLGSLFVIGVSPLIIFLSRYIDNKPAKEKHGPATGILKITAGFIFVGLSLWILALGAHQNVSLVPAWCIVMFILVQTIGEVLIVPTGFASVSKYAPVRFRSVMMSFWLMAISYGHYCAGFIAQFSLKSAGGSKETALAPYAGFFFRLGFMPLTIAAFLMILLLVKKYRPSV